MAEAAPDEPIYSFSDMVPAPERRHSERYTTTMRVGTMVTEAGSELCLVRNISCGGLRARVYSDVPVGTRATIELKSGQSVSGEVIWTEGDQIGLRFDAPVDVADVLSSATAAAQGQKARLPRIEIRRFATLRSGIRLLRGETVNISQGGVKLHFAPLQTSITRGPVVVTIAGLDPIPGVVRWAADKEAGVEFNNLVPLKRLFAWIGGEGARDGS
jgi:hypothetical protein